jgi:hypothetical protein
LAFLEGLTAVDLGLDLQNGKHFAAYQDMSEEKAQEITYQGAFGTDGPVLRRKRKADTGTLTFTSVLLRSGASAGMNDEDTLEQMEDFQCQTKRGPKTKTYLNCNWSRITIRSTLDQVTLDSDISVPGYNGPR